MSDQEFWFICPSLSLTRAEWVSLIGGIVGAAVAFLAAVIFEARQRSTRLRAGRMHLKETLRELIDSAADCTSPTTEADLGIIGSDQPSEAQCDIAFGKAVIATRTALRWYLAQPATDDPDVWREVETLKAFFDIHNDHVNQTVSCLMNDPQMAPGPYRTHLFKKWVLGQCEIALAAL